MKMFRKIRGKLADAICKFIAPEFIIINKSIDPFVREMKAEDGTASALCAKYLVGKAIEGGDNYLRVDFEGYSVAGHDCGNWAIVIARKNEGEAQ